MMDLPETPSPNGPSNEWDLPLPDQQSPSRAAAIAVWVAAAVELVVFGCCSVLFVAAQFVPASELAKNIPNEQLTVSDLRLGLLVLAVLSMLVMFLPALALLGLGFAVRQRKNWATITCLIIFCLQTAPVALMLLANLLSGLLMGDVMTLLLNVLFIGGVLAVQGWAIYSLIQLLRARQTNHEMADEPWNQHLHGKW